MPSPRVMVPNASNVSPPMKRRMFSKKGKAKSDLHQGVCATVQQAMKASSILSKDLESSAEYFDRDDVSKGTLVLKGEFFTLHKVKKLTGASIDVSEEDGIDDCESVGCGDEGKTSVSKKYVLKQVSQKHVTESEIMKQATLRLLLEAKYLARLDHPGLVKAQALKNAFSSSDFFIVTERMTETLEDRLDRWRSERWGRKPGKLGKLSSSRDGIASDTLAFRRTLRIAKALADVLMYLHDRNLAVLNLRPQSIGFLADGTLQITDLSCCREVNTKLADWDHNQDDDLDKTKNQEDILGFDLQLKSSETYSQMAKARSSFLVLAASSDGIPRYVAPEAIVSGIYTTAADTYSWGLMLFEMLTLSKPYAPFRMGQLLTKVCNQGHRHNLSIYKFSKELEGTLQLSWHAMHDRRPSMNALVKAIPLLLDLKAEVVANPQA